MLSIGLHLTNGQEEEEVKEEEDEDLFEER
jgi:hypothetical protein